MQPSYRAFIEFYLNLSATSNNLVNKTEQKFNPSPRFVSDVTIAADGKIMGFQVNIRLGKVWSTLYYRYNDKPNSYSNDVTVWCSYNCVNASGEEIVELPSPSIQGMERALQDFIVGYLTDFDMQPEHLDQHVLDLLIKAGRVQSVTTYKLKG